MQERRPPALQKSSQQRDQLLEDAAAAARSLLLSKEEVVDVKMEELVDDVLPLGDPGTLLAYPSTGGVTDYISAYISNDLFGADGPSRETFTNQPDDVAYQDYSSGHHGEGSGSPAAGSCPPAAGSCPPATGSGPPAAGSGPPAAGSDPHAPSSDPNAASSDPHGTGSKPDELRIECTDTLTNGPSYFNSTNVSEAPDVQDIGLQYSTGNPTTPFPSSHNYTSSHFGHNSVASPTSQVFHDSDSSGYSSPSPGAISAASISPRSSSGRQPMAPPQDLGVYHRRPGPSGYQTDVQSRGQQYSHYYQETGTSPAAGTLEIGECVSPGSDAIGSSVATCSSNALSTPSAPSNKLLPPVSRMKRRKAILEPPRRYSGNGSNFPAPSQEAVQTFPHPSSRMFSNGHVPVFSHPQGLPYVYDSPAHSSTASFPRTNESPSCQPFTHSLHNFPQSHGSPRSHVGQFHSQTPFSSFPGVSHQPGASPHGASSQGVSFLPNSVSGTPGFMSNSHVSLPVYYGSPYPSGYTPQFYSSMPPPPSLNMPSPLQKQTNLDNHSLEKSRNAQSRNCAPRKLANLTRSASRVFNPERQSTCDKCGVKVASSGHLHRHRNSHGADRRFRCSNCDCAFSRQDNLKNHMARAHGIGEVIISKKKRKKDLESVELRPHTRGVHGSSLLEPK
ncbi:Krueppel-like factor 4 [Procambarus clarkii]|uniref:Krueppel-like factor 4 n=1 Tax=Procambarus clarkii TaxID=6728 RepID=UPI0037437503